MSDPALSQAASAAAPSKSASGSVSDPVSGAPAHPLVEQARDSLRQTIDRYIPQLQLTRSDTDELKRQAAVKSGIDQLTTLLNKLDSTLLRVAVFGFFSHCLK